MTTTRLDVVQEARNWLGTPYHHQARLKGVGVDCVGLVIGICREIGLMASDFDVPVYARQPDGLTLLREANMHLAYLPDGQASMQPGDVVVVRFAGHPQHVGLIADYVHGGLSIIHAASNAGRVIETRLMFGPRTMQFVAAFALPGVA